MSVIQCRPGVDDDIYDLAAYLIDRSEDAARRFVDAFQITLKDLAAAPGKGSPKQFDDPALMHVRSWAVDGFPNHLIYYFRLPDGIDVLAVMHGARDVESELSGRVRT
jgi:toxin ParE1/3/4